MDTSIIFLYTYRSVIWLKDKNKQYTGKTKRIIRYNMRMKGFGDVISLTKEAFESMFTKSEFKWRISRDDNDGFVWYYPTNILKNRVLPNKQNQEAA